MALFISDKNVETCKSRTQILADSHKKWLWQNGSTLASHARGPGFESWARHSFLLLLKTSKSDKNVETKKINKSADAISSFIKKEKTLGIGFFLIVILIRSLGFFRVPQNSYRVS